MSLCGGQEGHLSEVPVRDKKLLISDEHKILLEEGEEEPLPTDCLGRGAMRKTNFPRLFVYAGEPG